MPLGRRQFISASATSLAAIAVLGLDGCATSGTSAGDDWSSQAPWTNSWDAADPAVVVYRDDGAAYAMAAADRVGLVPDGSGDRAMQRDDGHHQGLFELPAAPGPLWVSSSASFAGRAAWQSDRILEDRSYFTNFHSMLSPLTDKTDESQWFGWPQPWWGAILVAPTAGSYGNERVGLDGNAGMTRWACRRTSPSPPGTTPATSGRASTAVAPTTTSRPWRSSGRSPVSRRGWR